MIDFNQNNRTYIHRDIEKRIYKSFDSSFITALLGPRRVGKSTLVAHYATINPDRTWVTLNMDILMLRQRCAKGELQDVIQEQSLSLIGDKKKLWVIIDEAQKCPELFDQIKVIYDGFKDNSHAIKFILTGSGSLSLHELSAETLAGRIDIIYLREFCLREIASLKNNVDVPRISPLDILLENPDAISRNIDTLMPYRKILEQALHSTLIWGGLPEVVNLNSAEESLIYLGNYLQTYLEKDVRAVKEITHLNIYQKLLEIVASQTGSIREDKKILESLGCARDTLKKYRGYLIATLMYQEVYPYINSPLKRLTKSPKGFLINNGLISFLTGLHQFEKLKITGQLGNRFENWFLQELNSWLDRSVGKHQIYYWRTTGGVEVDFIVDKKPFVLPFEVTLGTEKNMKKIKHLKTFMLGEARASHGFYVYNGPYDFDKENNIYFLPAWIFC